MTIYNEKTIRSCKCNSSNELKPFKETLYENNWQQVMKKSKILFDGKSAYQRVEIFENPFFKKVLVLDGIVQTTEKDEFIYHEMLTHTPIFAHGSAENVLIIGGGDGGMLREVLRHKSIKKAVLVEIDGLVIDKCKEFMPALSKGAFEDQRAEIIIGDGVDYIKSTKEKFDIIICDSTDPVGSGLVLFLEEFYKNCKRVLNKNGILVTQNGVPAFQSDELKITYQNRKKTFKENGYFFAPVPSYIGGFMAFGWASDKKYQDLPLNVLLTRFETLKLKMKYYNPNMHIASFSMPEYIKQML